MSYILDALNKLERKRPPGSVPDLSTVHDPAPREPGRLAWRLWPALAALLLAAAGILAWLRPWTPATRPAESRPAQALKVPGSPLVVVSVPPAAPKKSPAQSRTQDGAAAPLPGADNAAAPAPPVVAPPEPPLPAKTPQAPPSAPEIPPPSVPEKVPPAPPALPVEAEAAPEPAPAQAPPPEATPQEILNLRISGHIFSEEPGLRMILIDNKVLREGDFISEGLRVEAITPGGAAIAYRGRRFEVKGRMD